MMRLLIFTLLLMPLVCRAETITFRSGEHPTFSRLVLDIPVGADWRLGRAGQDYALQVDPRHSFDTSAAFDRIPRDRVAALTPIPGTGRLIIDTPCACHATAFLFAPDRLVIDIADGPAPADSVFEASLDETQGAAPPHQTAEDHTMLALNSALLPDPLADAAATNLRISDAHTALLESLARAASQGILEINAADVTAETVSGADIAGQEIELPLLDLPIAGDTFVAPQFVRPGLFVQTSIDRDRQVNDPATIANSGSACLDDSLFDLAAWGDDSGFAAQIGAHLSTLTAERDRFSDGGIEALAKSYIYFGFGAEAKQTLALDGQRTPERDILREMADIIDEQPTNSTAFASQNGCETPVALWSALSRGNLTGTSEPERIAIIAAHRVLPPALRSPLGQRLAQLFLDAGEPETAAAILAVGHDALDAEPQPQSLTGAEVALAVDGAEPALETLAQMAVDENRMTPDALVALIDLSLAEHRPVTDDILQLAASMRFQHRGTADETALGVAESRALAAADRFSEAIDLLAGLSDLPPNIHSEKISEMVAAASERMSDAAFLEFALGDLPKPLPGAAENALAERLLDIGFPEVAARLVEGPADTAAMADRRRIRARADLALGHVAEAEAELGGMTDPSALSILTATDATAIPDSQDLWRAGDWAGLEQTDDALLQAASVAMTNEAATTDADTTLAERQALLEDAAATRSLAADLLARFVIDPADTDIPTN